MVDVNLIIKYHDDYLVMKNKNVCQCIRVPHYNDEGYFANISIFISILASGLLSEDFQATRSGDYDYWYELFTKWFFPDCLKQIDEDTFLYDFDELIDEMTKEEKSCLEENIKRRPSSIIWTKDIKAKDIKRKDTKENEIYTYDFREEIIDDKLVYHLACLERKRDARDVLLLYSGGKDSTLAAIRLKEMGYIPYFIHFNNGYMLDSDKPYLTFMKTFKEKNGYFFKYDYSNVDIQKLFERLFKYWSDHQEKSNPLTTEIRCLSCRMAMYAKTLKIAKDNNFKLVAEGARISQKFFIEQPRFIECIRNLATDLGIEVLFPVLEVDNDQEEIKELLAKGFSAKTWESKCLIGQEAVNKTKKDEDAIMEYYDLHIRPKVLNYLHTEK